MKRNNTLLLLATLLLGASPVSAQTDLNYKQEWRSAGASFSSAVAVDLDNDGMLEMLYGGTGNARTNQAGVDDYNRNRTIHVMKYNTNTKSWTIKNYYGDTYFDPGLNINCADRPSFSPCDINQDGIMDIVAFETTGLDATGQPYLDHINREGVFLGNGDGTFTQAELSFVDANGNPVDFDERIIISADVADFNNDGLPDIVGIGYQQKGSSSRSYPVANVVLLNRGGGVFEISNYFTDDYVKGYGQDGKEFHLQKGQVQAYDFNNDGYMDFFVNAQSDDRSVLGVRIGVSSHFSEIFLNDPENPGHFRRQHIYEKRDVLFEPMSEGGIAIADYNNDGVPDIFYSGWTGNDRDSYRWGIYAGNIDAEGNYTFTDLGHEGIEEMRNQNSTATQYVAVDWDGDGNFDLFNAGWSPRLSIQTAFISLGNGDGTFTNAYHMAGYSEGSSLPIDWDNNGVPDYVMVGRTADNTFFPTNGLVNTLVATLNPSPSTARPDQPTVSVSAIDKGKVTLSWLPAASAKNNVTYEYYVRNEATGRIVAGGNAFTDAERNGLRKVAQPGNAGNARSITLTLPNGNYTCGVQVVNARLQGSTFATATFTVSDSEAAVLDPTMPHLNDGVTNEEGCSYAGPIINRDCPDPTVIRGGDGYYYLFSTEVIHNVPVYRSENLVDWKQVTTAFTDATRPSFVKDAAIWAPDVECFDGKYYLYFSMSTWGGEWDCGIGVATATRAQGPYRNTTKLFISSEIGVQNSIDPFAMEDNGKKYLFWGSFRGIYGIELTDDGMAVADGARPQKIAGTRTEGTYIIKRDGYYYLIGSAGSCCDGANSTYHLLVARSENLFGPYVDKTGKKATDNNFSNLLQRSEEVIAPGHNANFVQDDAGQWWMIYHGYDAANVNGGRKAYLSQILWDKDGWPYVRDQKPTIGAPCPLIGPQYSTGVTQPTVSDSMGDEAVVVSPRIVSRDVTITHIDGEPFSYQVVNAQGNVIAEGKATAEASVDLYAVPTGMYIVTVSSRTGVHTEKVIRK